MTNFEFYKTKEAAAEAYNRMALTHDVNLNPNKIYFIDWLYDEYSKEDNILKDNMLKKVYTIQYSYTKGSGYAATREEDFSNFKEAEERLAEIRNRSYSGNGSIIERWI